MGEIYSIVYQPLDKQYGRDFSDFIREALDEALLVAGHGIEGDRKAGHSKNRQLNILSLEWLEGLRPLGYRVEPGCFGEQIIVRGLSMESLQPGDRLRIGDEALVEIAMRRVTCGRLELAQNGLSNNAFGNTAGMLARVIDGGTIRVGDRVEMEAFKAFTEAEES